MLTRGRDVWRRIWVILRTLSVCAGAEVAVKNMKAGKVVAMKAVFSGFARRWSSMRATVEHVSGGVVLEDG